MKTFDQWVKDYEGKTVGYPNNSSFLGQCLSLTKWHIKEVYGIEPPASGCNGARCYWSLFPSPLGTVLKKVPNTPDLVPKRGWIAVWNGKVGGGAGHIASVLSATVNNFVSLDQNWGGKQAHRVTHTYDNVYGFLAPIGEEETMVEVPSAKFEELVAKATAYDEFANAGHKSVDDVVKVMSDLNKKIEELENRPITPPEQPSLNGRLNGYTRKYIKDGVEIVENYAV